MAADQEMQEVNAQQERQLTDAELQAILEESGKKAEFPAVSFDEFELPEWDEWVEACNALLKGAPFDKIMYTKNYEGITFDPIYRRVDVDSILPTDDYPGTGDYLRGATVNGYVHEPWGVAQYCDESLPLDNNELLKEETAKGTTVYNIGLDSATRNGIDAKDAEVIGDTGVNITTVEDMNVLLSGLDFEKFPVMMYAGASAKNMIALVAAALKAQGKEIAGVRGTIGADPIGELLRSGKANLAEAFDAMAACLNFVKANAPKIRPIFVRGDVYTDGGAEAAQEVAYSFATAVEYIREMAKKGIDAAEVNKGMTFCFNAGANFFIEIAKLRAARVVWAAIMEGFGAEVRRRIMLGNYVLSTGYYDAYYKKAMQVRTLIRKDFEEAFKQCDVLLTPTSPVTAYPIDGKMDPLAIYMLDGTTIPVNMAGLPGISIPCGFADGLPVGMQIIGKPLDEETVLRAAYTFEQATEFHKAIAPLGGNK